jgi:hypothetical protein
MLTADLVRGTLRSGVVHPRFIRVDEPALLSDAETLVGLFRAHLGETVGDLDEAIEATFSGRQDILFIRGLAKLMKDLTEVESPSLPTRSNPEVLVTADQIRSSLFALAARHHPVRPGGGDGFHAREALIAEVATHLDLTEADVDRGLYADLASAQHLLVVPEITGSGLLERYNLALAQACLLRAREVRVTLKNLSPKRAQAILRALKFRRLLFRVRPAAPPEPTPTTADVPTPTHDTGANGPSTTPKSKPINISKTKIIEKEPTSTLQLVLDGPLSLFKHTSRYGIQLALFLPELTRCDAWELEADIRWGRERKDALLRLSNRSPLSALTPDRGTWESAEETHFREAFATMDTPWRLEPVAELIDLDGEDAMVPDYRLRHPDGRVALLDLVFAWRLDTFQKRLALIARSRIKNLIIAVTDRGRLDDTKAELATTLTLYRFKGLLQPKRIVALAEEVATLPTRNPPRPSPTPDAALPATKRPRPKRPPPL